jgi:hypothetical protein
MMNIAGTLDQQIHAAGIAIVSVSIGDATNKSTWTVQPPNLQTQAQSIIDGFDIPSEELLWQWYVVRSSRDRLLYGCDFTQISGAPLDAATITEWATYRETLRNIPQDQSDPYAIVWPTPPFVINPPPV